MSAATNERQLAGDVAYIRAEKPTGGDGVLDREARLHRRRKSAMISLLSEFEREIEPHLPPGHKQAIKDFKRSCREKLNGLTFEAVELMGLKPGERLNEAAADLAEKLTFDANGGQSKP